MMKLVLVYLGKQVPRYVFLNLILLQKRFPEYSVVFLSDYQHNLSKAEKKGITTKKVPHADQYEELRQNQLSYAPKFRDLFWYKTLARLFALNFYLAENPDEPILHIEADVLLLPNFPLERVGRIDHPLSFPLSTINQGAASTLFIKNRSALGELISFAVRQIEIDPSETDMTILAKYRLFYPERVLVMPTAPSQTDAFIDDSFTEQIHALSENLNFFGGLCDANTWGQYLTGEDERNNRGLRKFFHFQSHHAINTKAFLFYFDTSLRVKLGSDFYDLYALHVHSKDSNLFKIDRSESSLKRNVILSKHGPRNKLVFNSFLKIFSSKLMNSIKFK